MFEAGRVEFFSKYDIWSEYDNCTPLLDELKAMSDTCIFFTNPRLLLPRYRLALVQLFMLKISLIL